MALETLTHPAQEKAASEEDNQKMAQIRDNIINVPSERYDEIFSEFAEAVEKNNIALLADTVANWAVTLPRVKRRGEIVNRTLDDLPPLKDDPELYAVIQEYKAENKNRG